MTFPLPAGHAAKTIVRNVYDQTRKMLASDPNGHAPSLPLGLITKKLHRRPVVFIAHAAGSQGEIMPFINLIKLLPYILPRQYHITFGYSVLSEIYPSHQRLATALAVTPELQDTFPELATTCADLYKAPYTLYDSNDEWLRALDLTSTVDVFITNQMYLWQNGHTKQLEKTARWQSHWEQEKALWVETEFLWQDNGLMQQNVSKLWELVSGQLSM
ncbi:hypothetical protein LTR85_005953 [Meristemomyces frigidus]|nr:hypothetical protein LTR85_005953 [Meristemomyces frigidus]